MGIDWKLLIVLFFTQYFIAYFLQYYDKETRREWDSESHYITYDFIILLSSIIGVVYFYVYIKHWLIVQYVHWIMWRLEKKTKNKEAKEEIKRIRNGTTNRKS